MDFLWSRSLTEFHYPPMLTSLLRWLLLKDVKWKRDNASEKSVNVVSQQVLHNFKTDRQIYYKPVSDARFRNWIETSLSIGLALTIHKKTKSKGHENVLSQLQIGCSYESIDDHATIKEHYQLSGSIADCMCISTVVMTRVQKFEELTLCQRGDLMKKMKLKTFSTCQKKTDCNWTSWEKINNYWQDFL